jgi:hypothetical protein
VHDEVGDGQPGRGGGRLGTGDLGGPGRVVRGHLAHGDEAEGGRDVGGRLGGELPDHERGQPRGIGGGPLHGREAPPVAHHRDAVADGQDLPHLVRDEHDAGALGDDDAQRREEVVHLLRRQVGRRLVEDQDPGTPVEDLEDLDPLARADRQPVGPGARVHREPEPFRELLDAPGGLPQPARSAAGAHDDVLDHRVRRDLEQVLVHHADAQADRVPRRPDVDLPAVDADLAGVGPVQPVEHVHQRRLAGAVAADEAVDLAGGQLEVGVDEGPHRPERLADPGHRQRRLGRCRTRPRAGCCRTAHSTGVTSRSTSMVPLLRSSTTWLTSSITAWSTLVGSCREMPCS